jgi:hypothetical protein
VIVALNKKDWPQSREGTKEKNFLFFLLLYYFVWICARVDNKVCQNMFPKKFQDWEEDYRIGKIKYLIEEEDGK